MAHLREPGTYRHHPLTGLAGVSEIVLTKGHVCIVDDADFAWLSQWHWSLNSGAGGKLYAIRGTVVGGKRVTSRMHREILGLLPGEFGDHANRDTLDNRRSNLRRCSHSENMCNAPRPPNRAGFRGVFPTRYGAFSASIWFRRRGHYLGTFASASEAAVAYDKKARELHGPFAILNFPDEQEAA